MAIDQNDIDRQVLLTELQKRKGPYEQGGITGTAAPPIVPGVVDTPEAIAAMAARGAQAGPGDSIAAMSARAVQAGGQQAAPAAPVYGEVAGFDIDKIKDPNKSNSKYTPALKAFSAGLGSGVTVARNNLQGMVDYAKANGFAKAQVVGDDKIDFGDGEGPIDVVTSGGQVWFANNQAGQAQNPQGGMASPSPVGSGLQTSDAVNALTQDSTYSQLTKRLQDILGPASTDRNVLLRLLQR